MTHNELLVDALRGNLMFLHMTLGDMTDAELLQRPTPAANNGLWQLGHLIKAESGMVSACAGRTVFELPAGFSDRFTKDKASVDDLAALGTKDELVAMFGKVREATCSWVGTLTADDMAKPAPAGLQKLCPTVGHVVHLIPGHVQMHVGQMQVLRRKLGKPVLL